MKDSTKREHSKPDSPAKRENQSRSAELFALCNEVIVYHGGTEVVEQRKYDDPVKSPIIQEIIMCNRIGAISIELAKRLNMEPIKTLQMFYESKTCEDLHDKSTGLYLYGNLYVADEFMREKKLL